jgi:hypothetical protein
VEHSTPDVQSEPAAPGSSSPSGSDAMESATAGERLAALTERATDILERWTLAGERHERAVNQLESQLTEFEVARARLQRDTAQKMQDLERSVHHEWTALREVHEEPIRQLREQANSLTEVCIATAHSAQRGFDQAEARLAAIEQDLQQRLNELRREVQTVVGELRAIPPQARLGAQAPAWPLDGVTRLHQQLRQGVDAEPEPVASAAPILLEPTADVDSERPVRSTAASSSAPAARPAIPVHAAAQPPVPPDLSARLLVLERALDERESEAREVSERARRSSVVSRAALVGLAVVVLLAAGLMMWMQAQVSSRVEAARQQATVAAAAAAEETAATREQAAREIAAARELADRAQTMGAVLAAPDLVRFNLASVDAGSAASAQVLWSRTRGVVLSGSRLVPPAGGRTYQLWLVARGQAINVGTFEPDSTGSVTFSAAAPATPLPIIAAVVSLEPDGGSQRPDGPPVLVRARAES